MTAPNLDLLIQIAVTGAQIATGRHATGNLPEALFAGTQVQDRTAKQPNWTAAEEKFIVENYVILSDMEIGAILGRSATAIHVHREREMNLPGPSKAHGILTINRAAKMLGLNSCHALAYWFDAGLLPGYKLPGGSMCRLIQVADFIRWVCTPANWIYIDIDKITDVKLKRMAFKRRERWNDDWWSTVQVAQYHGVSTQDVKRYIKLGYIQAIQPEYSIGGRELNRNWKPWRVLRSEATHPGLHFWTRAEIRTGRRIWSAAADAWILKARDELGLKFTTIGRTMKRSDELIGLRYYALKKMNKEQEYPAPTERYGK
jgi:hypothetical protein